jgi:O-acetyl-ADP-ribose deacetylase
MGEGNEDYKLRKAVKSSLLLASERGFRSISMLAISSGIFGFHKDRCANSRQQTNLKITSVDLTTKLNLKQKREIIGQ